MQKKQIKATTWVVEYRHFIRHPLCMPLTYKVIDSKMKANQKEIFSQTLNVSLGGLLFSSKLSVTPGATIMIKMPFENKEHNVKAKVLRCVKNEEIKLYDIAVSFLRVHEAFKVKMIEQIYHILAYRDLLCLQLGKHVSLEDASRKWVKKFSEKFRKLYW